jgi:hypothetical protein
MLFMKTKSSEMTFCQNMSGNSLEDVFNQTTNMSNVTIGSVIIYNNIQGEIDGKLAWEVHQKGTGLGVTVGGSVIESKPEFEKKDK